MRLDRLASLSATPLRSRQLLIAVAALVPSLIACAPATPEEAETTGSEALTASPDLVISQVYGGGGVGGAAVPFDSDFIELFNRGHRPVSLKGKALQATDAKVAFSADKAVSLPDVELGPGEYFLVKVPSLATGNGAPLPEPDFVAPSKMLNLTATLGKVALTGAGGPLDACGSGDADRCEPATWIDLVGYGAVAGQFEGSPIPKVTTGSAVLRKADGCQDSNNNARDFTMGPPTPRNRASDVTMCLAGPPGPEGPAGKDGEDGAPGADGANGADGRDGVDGEDGPAGPPGSEGPRGAAGSAGPAGKDGAKGEDGGGCRATPGRSSSSSGLAAAALTMIAIAAGRRRRVSRSS